MAAADRIVSELIATTRALHGLAERGIDAVMPGYTHLQQAQPIRAAHWALSHLFAFLRDAERVRAARAAASVMPLGSGAIAGCPFPIDRDALSRELGFARVSENSLDAVSDRDWICDLTYAGAMIGMHLSRLGEDLVLFSSKEFGFVRLSDGYSTGSSLMPQKRNPDVAELARGKSGRLIGNLTAVLTLLKGLPTGYNRDLHGATGSPFTRQSKCENRPCEPLVRNLTTPSSYSDSPSAMTCTGAWIWLKMFSKRTGLDLSRPRIWVTTLFSRSAMEARFTGPSSEKSIARNSVGCRVPTNAASAAHGPPAWPMKMASRASRCASDARSSMMIVCSQPPSIIRCGVSNATRTRVPTRGTSPNIPSSMRTAQ
jgi:hypothetical protein